MSRMHENSFKNWHLELRVSPEIFRILQFHLHWCVFQGLDIAFKSLTQRTHSGIQGNSETVLGKLYVCTIGQLNIVVPERPMCACT
jgi:hypothetical protein